MVTKERLQELINQGATIYEVKYGKVNPVSLKNKIRFVSEKYPVIAFEPRPNEKYKHHKYFDKLYETQAEAEWVAKMHAQRPEFFEPPTYEDFIKEPFITVDYEDGYKFLTKDGHFAYIRHNEYSDDTDEFEVGGNRVGYKSFTPATKDNYIKACEYARNLFLGKEKENESRN